MRKDPLGLDNSTSSTQSVDVSQTFTPVAQRVIENAQQLAHSNGGATVESVHLLLGALQLEPPDDGLSALFQLSGLKPEEVRLYAQSALEEGANAPGELPRLGQSARQALRSAGTAAGQSSGALVDVTHIFIACFRPQKTLGLAEVLAPLGVSANQLNLHLRQLSQGEVTRAIQNESPLAQLTAHGERALEAAHAQMRASFCGRISTLHLLVGVLENPDGDAVAALQTLMIDVNQLREQANAALSSDGALAGPERRFTPAAKRALDRAKAAAREGERTHIGSADLLMGLLPQRALWVERAQFGAHPDDPAAALLHDVDANLVRAIFKGGRAPVAQTRAASNPLAILKSPAFLIFALQLSIGLALQVLRSQPLGTRQPLGLALLSVLVGAILLSALLAIIAQIFFQDARRKSAYLLAFAGALAGAILAMAIAGNP